MGEGILNSSMAVLSLLFFAVVIYFFFKKSRFPYAVMLVLAGTLLAYVAENTTFLSFLDGFKLSPELIFYIFLPTLIFESAFHINFRQFRQSSGEILWLSTLGVVINMGIVAAGLHYLLDIPWLYSLLFGALISPTDPVSVLAMFKRIGAPKRLSTIVEGESLINDGTALVLFEVMLGLVIAGTAAEASVLHLTGDFLYNVFGGIFVGIIFGFIFSKALDYVKNSKEIEISITLILAHFTFIVADYFFGVSGILATMAAGIVVGNYGAFKISPAVKDVMVHFWDYVSFVANSLLFLIIGLTIWNIQGDIWPTLSSLGIVILLVLVARALVVYGLVPIANLSKKKPKTPVSWMHVIQWGGLRGALVMALALTIPPETPFYHEMIIFSTGVVFFTMVFNGLTIEPMLAALGLKKLSKIEELEYDENKLLINQKICKKLEFMLEHKFISRDIHEDLNSFFIEEQHSCKNHLKVLVKDGEGELNQDQLSQILKRHLLGVEKKCFLKLYFHGEVTENLLNLLISNINLQLENAGTEKTPIGQLTPINPQGWIAKSLRKLGFGESIVRMEEREVMLRYEMYRARLIATDEALLSLNGFEDHELFNDTGLVADYRKKYQAWHKKAEEKIVDLETNYPDVCRRVKLFLAQRAACKVEGDVLNAFKESGIISEKLYQRFSEEMDKRYWRKLC